LLVSGAAPVRRMSRSARRHQLLDVAATRVVEHGLAAMSMERIAEWAGVSKALPYAHFDNVEHLLVGLYQREAVAIGREIVDALEQADPAEDLIVVRVRAWFDATARRAEVIRALTAPGSTVPAAADPDGEGARYSARLLYRYHGLDKQRALAVSGILQGALIGATTTWLHGLADRDTIERSLVAVVRALTASEVS
jgi:AcrR family transcriptional regulator